MTMTAFARAQDERELKSLGGTRTALIRSNAPTSEIDAIDEQIRIARAERTIRNVLKNIPAAERHRILQEMAA